MKKRIFTRGEDETCLAIYFLCLQINSFIDTSFFNFGINTGVVIPKIEFEKDNFCRGIKLIFQRLIWKVWLISEFLTQVEGRKHNWMQGHAMDTRLSKNAQNIAGHQIMSLGFHDMSPSWGHGWDMAGTYPTNCKLYLENYAMHRHHFCLSYP